MRSAEDIVRKQVRRILREAGYEDAADLDDAQPEVQAAVERYMGMDEDDREPVLLYWLLGSGTPPYKMSQEDSQYADDAGTREAACINCEYLYQKVTTGEHICSQIRGQVEPQGWCNQWEIADIYDE